jgi:hypothetical protein
MTQQLSDKSTCFAADDLPTGQGDVISSSFNQDDAAVPVTQR